MQYGYEFWDILQDIFLLVAPLLLVNLFILFVPFLLVTFYIRRNSISKEKNKRIQSIFCASASDIIRAVTSVLSHTKMGGRVVRSVALFFQTMQIRNIKQNKNKSKNKNN